MGTAIKADSYRLVALVEKKFFPCIPIQKISMLNNKGYNLTCQATG